MAWARKSSGVVVMGGFLLNGVAIIPNTPSIFGFQGWLGWVTRMGAMAQDWRHGWSRASLMRKDAVAIRVGTLQVADGVLETY